MKIPIFKTKIFIIRPFKNNDLRSLVKNINDKKIQRNVSSIPHPYTLKHGKDFLEKVFLAYQNKVPKFIAWTIEIDGEAAGGIGLHKIELGHKAEIGYWLARKHWGNGIMSEVVEIITKFGFDKLKLKRIYGKVYFFNLGSKKVLEKNGYKLEGLLKKETKKGNKYIDDYLLAKVR